jgi:hypothetical protein
LISAAKVGKNLETIVSLPEKVVSNQEKCVRNMSRGSLEKIEPSPRQEITGTGH